MDVDQSRLSASSKKALQFAWAVAQARNRFALTTPSVEVDSWDLLVGILLSHPGYSEAEQTFRYFGLVAGQALPQGYPQLTADGLNSALSTTLMNQAQPLNQEAAAIVREELSLGVSSSTSGVAELRSLWAALLAGDNEASSRIHDLLQQRGVNASGLAAETRTWVSGGGKSPYADVLARFPAKPVDVINYNADQSRWAGAPPDRSTTISSVSAPKWTHLPT